MKQARLKRRRISGVFEIRAATAPQKAAHGTRRFDSGAAHPSGAPRVICLLIPVIPYPHDET